MASAFNPKEGWIATANQMPFPPGWPDAQVTSREWIPDDRYRRIAAVLGGKPSVSVWRIVGVAARHVLRGGRSHCGR